MAYTNYTIVPSDGVVVIDGEAALGVSMTGIDPAVIHAIQWYGDAGVGVIEYEGDPITGAMPAPGSFTDPTIYLAQTDEAEAILYAANNPATYYSTANNNTVSGNVYNIGMPIVIYTPNPSAPPQSTPDTPPTPDTYQDLYWYNDGWVISSFDPNLSLAEAQAYLNSAVSTSAAEATDLQARIYSTVQLFAAADVSALDTADFAGYTLGQYQTFIDGEVTTLQGQIAAATSTADLYSFNPDVNTTP